MSVSRVVVTGLGVVSPLGVGVEINWRRLLENYSGIVQLNQKEYDGIPCRVAGCVPIKSENQNQDGSLNFSDYFSRMSELKSMSLASAFALVAAQEAIEQSQVNIYFIFDHKKFSSQVISAYDNRTRIGVSIGNGMAGLTNTCATLEQMKIKGTYRGMSPFYITQVLANTSAGHISIRHKLQGPNVNYNIPKNNKLSFSCFLAL
jgi:3-oxoacyl-[acyl-carrier-protein] synthase II